MPTLAEMRADTGPQPRPRQTKIVTLQKGQHLLAESEALADELLSLTSESATISARVNRDEDGERTGAPLKTGQGAGLSDRQVEIKARMDAIRDRQAQIPDELAQYQGEVGLTGFEGGAWQRFKDDHPPRKDNDQDVRLTGGRCNATAVFAALGQWVSEWNDETVSDGDWDGWLAERICYADRRDLVNVVVRMHEDGLARSGKFVSSSSTTRTSATG